jgi:predicted transcriptional regulator
MAKTTTMTVRLAPEVSDKLDVLARDMKRSKAYLASEAIAAISQNKCDHQCRHNPEYGG